MAHVHQFRNDVVSPGRQLTTLNSLLRSRMGRNDGNGIDLDLRVALSIVRFERSGTLRPGCLTVSLRLTHVQT
jgi:hypothetical protein